MVLTQKSSAVKVKFRHRSNGLAPWTEGGVVEKFNTSEMISINHPGWQTNTSGDSGGYFLLSKNTEVHSPGSLKTGLFEGQFLCGKPSGFSGLLTSYTSPSNTQLDAAGTTAISRVEPTHSVADVATFIGELRQDGLPRLRPEVMRATTKRARAAGSDYLNVEFGWKPMVSDLRKMALAVRSSHDIMENYRSHGKGQKIRRRFVFPTQSETASGSYGNFIPNPSSVNLFGTGVYSVHRQQDMWFSGAFRYHVPIGDTTADKIRSYASEAQKLLGVSLTPETVWNVSPWSWLVDWQTNTGDVLHNISAMGRDGLVLQYGYMMAHTLYEESASARFGGAGYASYIITSDTKVRRPATPYGFGVDLNALTSKQSAILVALGLSKT